MSFVTKSHRFRIQIVRTKIYIEIHRRSEEPRLANQEYSFRILPDTYISRVKRAHPSIHEEEILDVGQIEKKLIAELGDNVCVYERICAKYAERTLRNRSRRRVLDWGEVFRYE